MLSLLFGFQGRINRAQYWTGALLSSFVGVLLCVMLIIMAGAGADLNDAEAAVKGLGLVLLGIIPIIFLMAWCSLAVQVKRFHDRGKSGWLAAIPAALGGFVGFMTVASPEAAIGIAPLAGFANLIVGVWFFVELGCLPGESGPNQFGDRPGGGMSGPRPNFDKPQGPSSLETAQAAMERAIAERQRMPAMQRAPAGAPAPQARASAPSPAGAPGSAPTSFGRRTTR